MSLMAEGHDEEALKAFERALRILEATVGPDHPRTVVCRRNYRRLVQKNESPRT